METMESGNRLEIWTKPDLDKLPEPEPNSGASLVGRKVNAKTAWSY